jgi:hypothetical protein
MKTALFCTSYITPETAHRYQRWLKYYRPLLSQLKADKIVMLDDGSPCTDLVNPDLLLTWTNHLGRQSIKDYPGWWRSFSSMVRIAEEHGFDKLIHIESDFFVLSPRMLEYLASLSSGWTAMYCQYYDFPETAIQVICKDSFEAYRRIYQQAVLSNYSFPRLAEHILPFTHVEKQFNGDRIGEPHVLESFVKKGNMAVDYLGQLPVNVELEQFREIFKW